MKQLILIKHASPKIDPSITPDRWHLSDPGKAASAVLAARLREYRPAAIISSEEPKAIETAEVISKALGVPTHAAPGLHEHDRSNVPHLPTREFISSMELFFRRPGELVFGRETADAALARFTKAMGDAMKSHGDSIAVVTHGTVLALYLASRGDRKPFDLWRQMGLPSFARLSLPALKVEEIVMK